MRVLYNFDLKSKHDRMFDPWLQDIFHIVTNSSDAEFTLRVTKEKTNRKIVYKVENKKNKTYALITKRRDQIQVEFMCKQLPDASRYIKPMNVLISAMDTENNHIGKQTIADYIMSVMCVDNDYSLNRINKVKVHNSAYLNDDSSFIGGLIESTERVHDQLTIVTTKGFTFFVDYDLSVEKRTMVNKYLVLKNKNDFEVIQKSEFDTYFELV